MNERNKRITVSLSEECYEALRKYAFDVNTSLSMAMNRLCEERLETLRYGAREDDGFKRLDKDQ